MIPCLKYGFFPMHPINAVFLHLYALGTKNRAPGYLIMSPFWTAKEPTRWRII